MPRNKTSLRQTSIRTRFITISDVVKKRFILFSVSVTKLFIDKNFLPGRCWSDRPNRSFTYVYQGIVGFFDSNFVPLHYFLVVENWGIISLRPFIPLRPWLLEVWDFTQSWGTVSGFSQSVNLIIHDKKISLVCKFEAFSPKFLFKIIWIHRLSMVHAVNYISKNKNEVSKLKS